MTVTVGNISPGLVSTNFMRSILDFAVHDSKARQEFRGFIPVICGGLLDIGRNVVVDSFLKGTTDDWLWFIDSDIEITRGTLYSLLEYADVDTRPVIAGIYPILQEGVIYPSIYYRGLNDKGEMTMLPYQKIPREKLVEVDGAGTGCMLIHRDLLEKMRANYPINKPWFDNLIYDDVPYGEDLTFCMKVKEMGFSIYTVTDPPAILTHDKTIKLGFTEGNYADA